MTQTVLGEVGATTPSLSNHDPSSSENEIKPKEGTCVCRFDLKLELHLAPGLQRLNYILAAQLISVH